MTEKAFTNKKRIEEILAVFSKVCPTIVWDRFIANEESITLYGWIPRGTKSDFLLLEIEYEDLVGGVPYMLTRLNWTTSSARYSPIFSLYISGDPGEHTPCEKIAGSFELPADQSLS